MKDVVRRFVYEAVNGAREEFVGERFAPDLAGFVKKWFG